MTAPRLPEPFARNLHPAEIAELARDGQHCDVRRCREPVTIYGWYHRRTGGQVLGYERFLCNAHGEDFARRHHLTIEPAPAESDLPDRSLIASRPGAFLFGMSADMFAAHDAARWHCDYPGCRQRARYFSALRYAAAGRIRHRARFLCDGHAERFAAAHGIDIAAVLPPEGDTR